MAEDAGRGTGSHAAAVPVAHELIQLCIFRKTIYERHKRTAILDKPTAGFRVCDIAHLLRRDVQKFGEFFTVRSRLIEHGWEVCRREQCPPDSRVAEIAGCREDRQEN